MQYEIKVESVTGVNGLIFTKGSMIDESRFNSAHISDLKEMGAIVEVAPIVETKKTKDNVAGKSDN